MRFHRLAALATAALAVCLGGLSACGGSSDDGEPASKATPPAATTPAGSSESPAPEPPETPLDGKVVVIDPGHNGGNAKNPSAIAKQVDIGNGRKECDTTGTATNAGYPEHAFTWDVSKRLERLLKARGAKVVLTRPNDTGVGPCINERAEIGNRAKADAVLSVHADGAMPNGRGFHIIEPVAIKGFNAKAVPESLRLGKAIRDAYHEGTGVPYSNYRGKKALDPRNDLGGLNLSKVPKVFIECGNMRNPEEARKFADAGFRQKIADSLLVGLTAYLG
ncbi:N-acetylmuramoyl-L-alanine amidase [Spirillospora sp. CA-294931]|uniref:N-acetylmuramoyl-L-alanine amidase n=1 Tax=Spirillospora sp. CA-294931 TaxID=3240042 RepID=UPI003D950653